MTNPLKIPLNKENAPQQDGKKEMSGTVVTLGYIVGSIVSAVGIVMCNKKVFENGFRFPCTLSWIAYCFTYFWYQGLQISGAWKPKGVLPLEENIKVACAAIASISFMNLCLLYNTVAIYQICKFLLIPVMLIMQLAYFGLNTNRRVILSLSFILFGVWWATGTSFDAGALTLQGITFAVLAVVSTSLYRIWNETKQKAYGLKPDDLQNTMAGWQALLGAVIAVLVEFFPVFGRKDAVVPYFVAAYNSGFGGDFPACMMWMLGTCVMALTVNFTSFGVIGKAGPIAFAVVGHAKTAFTIILGFIFFPQKETAATIWADIIGCIAATIGVVLYTHFEYCLQLSKPDIYERLVSQKTNEFSQKTKEVSPEP